MVKSPALGPLFVGRAACRAGLVAALLFLLPACAAPLVARAQDAGASDADPVPPVDPLLVARQYGRGRVLAYFTESDWRWATERAEDGGDRLLAVLWGRMARWAASRDEPDEAGPQIELSRDVARAGEEVSVRVEGIESGIRPRLSATGPGGSSPASRRERIQSSRPSSGRRSSRCDTWPVRSRAACTKRCSRPAATRT